MTSPEIAPQEDLQMQLRASSSAVTIKPGVRRSKRLIAYGRSQAGLFRERLHDTRFWVVQALVVVISVVHTVVETGHILGNERSLYLIPVSTYFIPVMYAALNFGLEGAIPTTLWCWLVTTPNIIFLHHGAARFGVILQLGIMLGVASLVASRVDRERQAKLRAEAVSTRLSELNAAAAAASQSLELSQVLTDTLRIILQRGQLRAAWIVYTPDGWESRHVAAFSGRPPQPFELPEGWEQVTRQVAERGEPRLGMIENASPPPASTIIVPISVAERVVGVLGVETSGAPSGRGDVEHLNAIASQLGLALENIGHYQEAKAALGSLARTQKELENYIRLATEAEEQERKRLARELHDGTLQSLVVIKGYLESVGLRERSAKAQLEGSKRMLTETIDDLRRFSHSLRPSILDDLGLAQAIESLAAELRDRTGGRIDVDIQGPPRRLDPGTELAVYRIVQEALHNAEKHSGATHVGVTLTFSPDSIAAQVTDDGSGFEPSEVRGRLHGGEGLGLRGMEERTKQVGGVLTIRSGRGRGTVIKVDAPGGE